MWTGVACPTSWNSPCRRCSVSGRRDDAPSRGRQKTVEERLAVREGTELAEDLARHGTEQQRPGGDALRESDRIEVGAREHRRVQQGADPCTGPRLRQLEQGGVDETVTPTGVLEQPDED